MSSGSRRISSCRQQAIDLSRAADKDRFEALGTLTLRDVTRDLALPFTLEVRDHPEAEGQLQARAIGEIEVLRLDYGVGQGIWQDTSVVANEVVIKIDIVARRPKS